MTTISNSDISIVRLRTKLAGEVIAPGDDAYDASRRVFTPLYDKRPAAIVRPANDDEIAHVVSLARDSGLELAVRSGGHSAAAHGTSDGGIVLDLSGDEAAGDRRRPRSRDRRDGLDGR